MSEKKSKLLGMGFSKASYQLMRMILFNLVCQINNSCFRCGLPILSVKELSIDHKIAWQQTDDPIRYFFDLNNVSFSHISCNCKAASRPTKIYANKKEQEKNYTKIRSKRRKQNYDPAKRRAFYLRTGN